MAEQHGMHLFDEDKGYYLRQTTDEGEDNCWELCNADGETIAELDDADFDKLRDPDQPNPEGVE